MGRWLADTQNTTARTLWIGVVVVGIGGCGAFWSTPPTYDGELRFNLPTTTSPAAPQGTSVFQEAPLSDVVPGFLGHHAATITALPDGELLAAWYAYTGPHELDGSTIFLARRSPGGPAWGEPIRHLDRPTGDGNPVLYSEDERVWLFLAAVPFGWSTAHIEMQISEDRGATWSPPATICGTLGSNVRNPPVRTADGALVLPAYTDLIYRTLFLRSEDGVTWDAAASIRTPIPAENLQPAIARLSTGRLVAVMRNVGGGWLWVTASDDDGRTWMTPLDSGLPNSNSAVSLTTLAGGALLLVYNDSRTALRPLAAALSYDEGATWPFRRVIGDGEGSYRYPSVAQTPDGLIHILYTRDRKLIQHVTLNEAWIAEDAPTDPEGSSP